ncbi:MAG: WbqC family protein [Salegentibacter sp.]
MEKILMHPSYFGAISQYVAMAQAEELIFENEDNYQKQTYRNRMYIYDSNGKLLLNVPIKHKSALGIQGAGHQKYKEVQIENEFDWQQQHWRALKASYQTSPFFEFYEDEISPLYHSEYKFLMDFNYDCMEFAADALQLDLEFEKTSEYILHPENVKDLRPLINAKSGLHLENERYHQVFEPKHGFIPDLSILDLLFNQGPGALQYLEEHKPGFNL